MPNNLGILTSENLPKRGWSGSAWASIEFQRKLIFQTNAMLTNTNGLTMEFICHQDVNDYFGHLQFIHQPTRQVYTYPSYQGLHDKTLYPMLNNRGFPYGDISVIDRVARSCNSLVVEHLALREEIGNINLQEGMISVVGKWGLGQYMFYGH